MMMMMLLMMMMMMMMMTMTMTTMTMTMMVRLFFAYNITFRWVSHLTYMSGAVLVLSLLLDQHTAVLISD